MTTRGRTRASARTDQIVGVLEDAFAPLMAADPVAFRGKFRKMARDPHAFYRGSACLFYADVVPDGDPWSEGRAGQVWVHGDLHVENFGTYLSSDGRLVFDVNDFDEAYLGRFTWDLQRFAASLALVGWQKALPEDVVRDLVGRYAAAYLRQVDHYLGTDDDQDFALRLDNTHGPVHDALVHARRQRRGALLDRRTTLVDGVRMLRDDGPNRRLDLAEQKDVLQAYDDYLATIPEHKRLPHGLAYTVRDVVATSGFGIGSAGLPAYNLLVEGPSQALDDDVLLSMKQANVPAVSRFVDRSAVESAFAHEGHRTAVSQRALQAHTDPWLGWTELRGTGFVVSELSPFEVDLDWDGITEPDDAAVVVDALGRATAKVHCSADEDSEQDLVDLQVEEAVAEAVEGRREDFTTWLADFGVRYADQVREDHALFVEAFRSGHVGVTSTA